MDLYDAAAQDYDPVSSLGVSLQSPKFKCPPPVFAYKQVVTR